MFNILNDCLKIFLLSNDYLLIKNVLTDLKEIRKNELKKETKNSLNLLQQSHGKLILHSKQIKNKELTNIIILKEKSIKKFVE